MLDLNRDRCEICGCEGTEDNHQAQPPVVGGGVRIVNKYTKKQLEILIALKEDSRVLVHWYGRGRFGKERTYLQTKGLMDRITVRNDYYHKFATDNLITQVSHHPWSADFKISEKGLKLLEQAE